MFEAHAVEDNKHLKTAIFITMRKLKTFMEAVCGKQ